MKRFRGHRAAEPQGETQELLDMIEIWLKPNRRVLMISFVPVLAVAATSVAILLRDASATLSWIAIALLITSALLLIGIAHQLDRPRIAYHDGKVLFYLRAREPVSVPLEVVEAFFMGQSPVRLPGPELGHTESINLIARLSQRYPEWAKQDVKHALGSWCDSYVTIRGTWCEKLDEDLVRSLNRKLSEACRRHKEQDRESLT